MIERTSERFGLEPKRLARTRAYGTAKFLGWLVKQDIAPHIPVWDKSTREDGTFSRADFVFDPGAGFLHLSGQQTAQAVPPQLLDLALRQH